MPVLKKQKITAAPQSREHRLVVAAVEGMLKQFKEVTKTKEGKVSITHTKRVKREVIDAETTKLSFSYHRVAVDIWINGTNESAPIRTAYNGRRKKYKKIPSEKMWHFNNLANAIQTAIRLTNQNIQNEDQ